MRQFVILKLDTPLTLVKSAMRVPQAEPVNFAKAMVEALPNETVDIVMLGLSSQTLEHKDNGTIRTLPYYGDPKSIANQIMDDAIIILWQGRHTIQVPTLTNPGDKVNKPQLTEPYAADYYEKLSFIKSWQVQMYNLMSSSVIANHDKKYFVHTDARLPLLELNKIDPVAVPKPLPKGIVMLTQAYQAEAIMHWHNKWGNGQFYSEMDIAKYVYQFEESMYLPLHSLPLMSHLQYCKPLANKTKHAIFQIQSIKYADDYRKKMLGKAIKFVKGDVDLHGRFDKQERAVLMYQYPDYAERLIEQLIDNSNTSECFYDSAKTLSDYLVSLVITDGRYARFGLCPNRFVEAIAVGTLPVSTNDVFTHCDDVLKHIAEQIDVKHDTISFSSLGTLQADAFNDKAKSTNDGREKAMLEARECLYTQLMQSFVKLAWK